MSDTDTAGTHSETGTDQPLKNNANVEGAETLQKQLEKERIERMQEKQRENEEIRKLRDQLEAKNKAEEEARRQQLEENEQFKTLYEREKQERERREAEIQDAAKKANLSATQTEIFAKFPKEVVEVATTAGLSLSDDTDDAKALLEGKLKALADKVVPRRTSSGNNPVLQTQAAPERADLLKTIRGGNDIAQRKAIGSLNVIQEMRQIAGVEKVEQ